MFAGANPFESIFTATTQSLSQSGAATPAINFNIAEQQERLQASVNEEVINRDEGSQISASSFGALSQPILQQPTQHPLFMPPPGLDLPADRQQIAGNTLFPSNFQFGTLGGGGGPSIFGGGCQTQNIMADVVGNSGGVQRGDGGQIRFHTSHSQSPIVSHHIFGGGQSEHPGELIPSKCYTYHSIGELATQIPEQQTLSLDLASSSAKLFKFKRQTLLVAQSDDKLDINLLINQQDLIKNVLAPLNLEEEGKRSCLVDFTFLAKSNYLCLLYSCRAVILDISSLLSKSIDQQNPIIVQSIDFQSQKCSRIETDNESLIVVMQKNGGIVQIKTTNFEIIHTYKLEEGQTSRNVKDIHINGQIMSVLFDKNEIQVFDLKIQQKIFKAFYRDASGQINRLFYINQKSFFDQNLPDSDEEEDVDEADLNRFIDDEFVGDDEEPSAQSFTSLRQKRLPLFQSATQSQQVQSSQFQGHFILIETQTTKGTNVDGTGNVTSFEKLIIAKILNQTKQALEQSDYLKLNDKCKKFVEFDNKRGIIFLLNIKKVQSKTLTLYSIKLKQSEEKGSDSSSGEDSPRDGKIRGIKFWFIKEMCLAVNATVQHKLSLTSGRDKAPYFMKVMRKKDEFDRDQELYFVYTSIAGQILSHQLVYSDLIQNQNKLIQYANNQGSILATGGSFAHSQSILGPDPFAQTDHSIPFDHTSNALSQTLSFGVISQSDKEREKIKSKLSLNNEELKVDEEQETVKRELQEAIDKELETLNISKDNVLGSPLEEVKVTKQPKNPQPQPSIGKEIILNSEQIKMIQQQKQQQQQQQQAITSKKKKKSKKPAPGTITPSTANQEPSNYKNNPSSRNPSPQPQKLTGPPATQQIAQPNTYQQRNAQVSQPQQQKQQNPQPQQQKKQQQVKPLDEQMIANFAELTKRYQDLALKFENVQEQLLKQSSQAQDLESLVQRSISTILPTMVEQQMKEKIVPMMISSMKGIDRQINEQVMPQIETQIKQIVNKAIQTQNQGREAQQRGKTEIQEEVKQIVVTEFATAMRDGIKPILQEQFRSVILDVRQSLKQVNDDFSQKLQEEQEKNQSLFEYFKTMLSPLPQQQDAYLMPPPPLPYGVPSQFPGYFPYPMPHPGYPQPYSPYPPQPQYQPLKPLLSHVSSSPSRQHTSGPSFSMSNPPSELIPSRSVQQTLQQQIENLKPIQKLNSAKESNKIFKNEKTQRIVNSTQIQQKEVLIYDDDEGMLFDNQIEESKGSDQIEAKTPESAHIQSIQRSELAMTTVSQNQQDFSASPVQPTDHNNQGTLFSNPLLANSQLRSQEPKINWDFLPYMKEVATQGKANSADFLLCNADQNNFLRESIFLVQNNSRIITNQYKSKLIHNFIKKVYQRAKENERARKGGLEVISVFLEKIYRKRAEMKQYVQQVTQWEEELKVL